MIVALLADEGTLVRLSVAGEVCQKQISLDEDIVSKIVGPDAYQRRVLVDLGGVTWLDSSGVGWLLACQKKFRAGGGLMVLHSAPRVAADMLQALRMHLVFKLAPDEASARKLAEPREA